MSWITKAAAAALMGVDHRTAAKYLESSRVRTLSAPGARTLYQRDDVLALLRGWDGEPESRPEADGKGGGR